MPICHCNIVVIPPADPCAGCLNLKKVTIGCSDGPLPCGTTVPVDLGVINTLTACSGIPVWRVKYFDPIAFSGVTISPTGLLNFTTNNIYKEGKEYVIIYEVDCPGTLLREEAEVRVCFQNPCPPGCKNCNPCTSACITANDGNTNGVITSTGCPDTINTFDLKTISSYADCGTGITYALTYSHLIFSDVTEVNGVISYKILPAAVSGATYYINYVMTCPDFQIKVSGTLIVLAKTLCHDVVCPSGQMCDPCTGLCVPIPPEISIGNNINHQIGIS